MSRSHMRMTVEEYVAYSGKPLHPVNRQLLLMSVLRNRAFCMCQCGTPIPAPTWQEISAAHEEHWQAELRVRD